MMNKCAKCGSTEIVSELVLFGDVRSGRRASIVILVDPAKKNDDVQASFRADVCGSCGYTEFYTKRATELLDAHKKGYISEKIQ